MRTHPSLSLVIPLLLACSAPALADGFILVEHTGRIAPRPRPRPMPRPPGLRRGFPLAVENHDVKVTIDGSVATTEIDQVFRNPLDQRLEGMYMFPLPADAALDQFSMWIDGKEMQGEVLDSQKALSIYEGIVRRMQDPALLEYAGRGLFKVRIFPIEPRSTKRVRLTYRQTLTADAGRVRYRYPLNTEKFSSQPLQRCTLSVSIKADQPLKGIYSPWHDVDVRRTSETAAVASYEAKNVTPNRDFVLDYDLAKGAVGCSVRTHVEPGREGTFLLTISPQVEVERQVAKDVVFVLDTSGSMAAEDRMAQARRALSYMIARLDGADRFSVIDFATDARSYKEGLVPANDDEKKGATHYVSQLVPRGGTAIDEALSAACKLAKGDDSRPFSLVFLTDGEPTIGERDPQRILENLKSASSDKSVRVFVWGVGNDLNAELLDGIARQQRGDSYYVLPGEDIEVSMSSFYDKIAAPVLTDLSLSVEGVRVSEVYPRELPDLFRGSQLLVLGRYSGEGHAAIRLRGKVAGETREYVFEAPFRASQSSPHIPRLWAKRKIGYLLEQIRAHGQNEELKREIVRLARRYGLPTPYTSYLVLEEGAVARPTGRRGGEGQQAMENAFRRLREEARKSEDSAEQDGFSAAPAPNGAPAKAGKAGVRHARLAGRLRRGQRADLSDALALDKEVIERSIRTIGDKTFYRTGEGWTDSEAGERKPTWKTIELLSDAYFALLKQNPKLGAYLALGKVVVKLGETVYEIK
ncbi:MAG TPA: trypsin [Planctomycetes bacterium]|nr:trypsin [Planctomycetota bacterium]